MTNLEFSMEKFYVLVIVYFFRDSNEFQKLVLFLSFSFSHFPIVGRVKSHEKVSLHF